ncbi:universal stress protein [Streptosporangium sp. NPDC023615]|uniref:universal stress protein n=1 Tax=Streptosporangium sp. NPDC023615 TaxID=3154794 RepID=UPI003412C749
MTAYVMVGTDGSAPAGRAVAWAAEDAARRGLPLRIVHACEPWTYDIPMHTPPGFHDLVAERGRDTLRAAADLAGGRAPGLEVVTVLRDGPAAEVLRREAADAAQIVVGSRGLGGFTGLLLGSVSRALAGHLGVPVVVVGPRDHDGDPGTSGHPEGSGDPGESRDTERVYGRIVVGFDGSAHSEAALAYAFEEAARRGVALRAVHAWQMPVLGPGAAVHTPLVEDISATEERVASGTLVPWLDKYPRVEVERVVVCGHPAGALCDASATADLVVVGSRGLGGIGAAVLGSVGHGVLHHAHCPVAVVRAGGEA